MHYTLLKNTGNAAHTTVKAAKRIQLSNIIWPDEHVDYNLLQYASKTCKICRTMEEVLELCEHMDKKELRVVRMTEERDSSAIRERFEVSVFKANGFEVEIVTGISNINRISAMSLFPLTVRGRNESFWVWDGTSAPKGQILDSDLWERVAATSATMAIMNPSANHLFKGIRIIAAYRHAHTPVLFCSKQGQYRVVSLEQLLTSQSFDWSACHLLIINPSPQSIPRMALPHSDTAITLGGCVAS